MIVKGSLSASVTIGLQVKRALVATLLPGKILMLFKTGSEFEMTVLALLLGPSTIPSLGVAIHAHD